MSSNVTLCLPLVVLDNENSFAIARNNLEKEEELILQRLVKNLYCQGCLKAAQDGTNPRRLSVDRLKDFLHPARDAGGRL